MLMTAVSLISRPLATSCSSPGSIMTSEMGTSSVFQAPPIKFVTPRYFRSASTWRHSSKLRVRADHHSMGPNTCHVRNSVPSFTRHHHLHRRRSAHPPLGLVASPPAGPAVLSYVPLAVYHRSSPRPDLPFSHYVLLCTSLLPMVIEVVCSNSCSARWPWREYLQRVTMQ